MTEDGTPIAYSALEKGVPVVSQSGRRFGTVERVVDEPAEGILHGIVVATDAGLRFVDRAHVGQLTTAQVRCALTDDEAAALPAAAADDPDDGEPQRSKRPWFGVGAWTGPVVIVRCSRGGLFETLWIPLVSLKAVRLGPFRIQRCPVHRRWELVQLVDPETLSAAERAEAARYPAEPIP